MSKSNQHSNVYDNPNQETLTISLLQGNNSSHGLYLPGAQREKVEREDEEGHGAAILSLKSHVKLKPVTLSNTISAGKLRSKHPAFRKL